MPIIHYIYVYPSDFVERVKAEFPNLKALHCHLDRGHGVVGAILYGYVGEIEPWRVIEVSNNPEKQEKLAEYAARLEYRRQLYAEWDSLALNPIGKEKCGN